MILGVSPLMRSVLVGLLALGAFLAYSGWVEANGFFSEASTHLWARAILQAEGPETFGSTDAIYPPLPLVVTILVRLVTEPGGVPGPTLIASAVAALTAALWFANLTQRGGYHPVAAFLVTAALCLNPLYLRAVSSGPEMTFLCLGTWIFARGIVHLRLSGNAPDMMKVAVGMLIIGVSSSYGLLIALGSLPFLAIAGRPSMLAASAGGYVMAMVFPVACTVGSLLFVGAIFNTPLFPPSREFTQAASGTTIAWIFLLGALLSLMATIRLARYPSYSVPILCAVGTIGSAICFDRTFGLLDDPVLAAAPLVSVGAAAIRFWPPGAARWLIVSATVPLVCVALAVTINSVADGETLRWSRAVRGEAQPLSSAESVASFLSGRDGIVLDAARNPDLVVALGSLDGLILSGDARYEILLSGGLPDQPYIVARGDPAAPIAEDRLLRRFPHLRTEPPFGYAPVYVAGDWTVLGRQPNTPTDRQMR